MPYIDGKRVSNAEWQRQYGSVQKLHTGPNGENPAGPVVIDEETGVPPVVKGKRNRSPKSAAASMAAIADALGVATTSAALADIDLSGLDADNTESE